MIRHLLIAAWRNMAGNRLLSAIAILGLAVGIAAALLMALVVRNQMTFDSFIPGHERTFRMFFRTETDLVCRNRPGSLGSIQFQCLVNGYTIPTLKDRLPAIESIAQLQTVGPVRLQQGNITAWDSFFWASPEFFTVMPLPVLHGTLKEALAQPDDVVLTSTMARKYFGGDDVVGRTLMVAGYPMIVRAVLRDLPQNASSLDHGIFVSTLGAPHEPAPGELRNATLTRPGLPEFQGFTSIFLRLKPGASLSEADLTDAYWSAPVYERFNFARRKASDLKANRNVTLLRLDRVNLWEPLNPGVRLRLAIAAAAGALVLLIAAINFINLMVTAVARREKEVGIRKSCGGGRGALMTQFLGESVIAVSIAAMLGVALTELLLPPVNAFLRTGATLDYSNPLMLVTLLAVVLVLALTIGAWPAFILSGFRPAFVLRGWTARTAHAGAIRGTLATLQFAILIVLAIAASVVWIQRDFATRAALRVNGDQMLVVRIGATAASRPLTNMTQAKACPLAFVDQVRKLSGVRGVACSSGSILAGGTLTWLSRTGPADQMDFHPADPRIFALYGVKPIAGNLPQVTSPDDTNSAVGAVINMAAVRKLGFASPQAALGNSWVTAAHTSSMFENIYTKDFGRAAIITAVVPDFSFAPVNEPIAPTLYAPLNILDGNKGLDLSGLGMIHIKLNGHDIPETLTAIDRIWVRSGIDAPLDRFFLDSYMQQLYQDMTREAQFFAAFAGIAIVLACLGLLGIAVSTAERRTKEIGIRKSMGATSTNIVLLLLWQFSQPVLWANVVAWPVAWWLMQRWLSGFAYHIDLHWWLFVGASLVALLVALLTVAGQAFLTARQKPVLALRYE